MTPDYSDTSGISTPLALDDLLDTIEIKKQNDEIVSIATLRTLTGLSRIK
jgi:hypothetical protein